MKGWEIIRKWNRKWHCHQRYHNYFPVLIAFPKWFSCQHHTSITNNFPLIYLLETKKIPNELYRANRCNSGSPTLCNLPEWISNTKRGRIYQIEMKTVINPSHLHAYWFIIVLVFHNLIIYPRKVKNAFIILFVYLPTQLFCVYVRAGQRVVVSNLLYQIWAWYRLWCYYIVHFVVFGSVFVFR